MGETRRFRPFGDKRKSVAFGPQSCRSSSAARWLIVSSTAAVWGPGEGRLLEARIMGANRRDCPIPDFAVV